MDCLRTAKFTIDYNESFIFGSQTFSLRINSDGINVQIDLNGKFDIQGFKNVDVYGIKFIPSMKFTDFDYFSSGSTTSFSFTNNYDVIINLDGQIELLGGISSLSNPVLESTKDYVLNNFAPEVLLNSPVKSCKSIEFKDFKATFLGLKYANTGAMSGHNMNVNIKGDMYFYYKFEGE